MSAATPMRPPSGGPVGPLTRWARAGRARFDVLPEQTRMLSLLVALSLVIVALVALAPDTVPLTALLLPLLGGSLLLGPRRLPGFVAVELVLIAVSVAVQDEITRRLVIAALILAGGCLVVLAASRRRSRLGVASGRGEAMFVDLRDRLLAPGRMPDLPIDWRAQAAMRSAGDTPFSGDVVLTRRSDPPGVAPRLDLLVVDVSGKGEQAGIRALQLAGAFGGLLGALAPADLLPAANAYVLDQGWTEGFASAVHLSVDLGSGEFELRTAGHPPPAVRRAGSGRWAALETEGPLLGLIDTAEFEPVGGVLGRGDLVALYTDGMVEEPRRDIGLGIDRLMGGAERLLAEHHADAAEQLVDRVGSPGDDRTVVLLARD